MVRSGMPTDTDGQQSLGDLVALAAKDISQLIRFEISLAKSELRMDARRVGLAALLVAIGLFVGCLVIVLLCFAFAYGLVEAGLPEWAAFLVVAFVCVLLGAIACLIAYLKVRKVTGMRMTRRTIQEDLELLRRGEASPDGAGPAVRNPESVRAGSAAEIPRAS